MRAAVALGVAAAFLAASGLAAPPPAQAPQRPRAEIEAEAAAIEDYWRARRELTPGEEMAFVIVELLLDIRDNTAPPPGPRGR